MISYIASLCIALPVTLLPVWVLSKTSLVDKAQAEVLSHDVGQTCARWLLKIMPFCQISVLKNRNNDKKAGEEEEEPSIWVCNHSKYAQIKSLQMFVYQLTLCLYLMCQHLCWTHSFCLQQTLICVDQTNAQSRRFM